MDIDDIPRGSRIGLLEEGDGLEECSVADIALETLSAAGVFTQKRTGPTQAQITSKYTLISKTVILTRAFPEQHKDEEA